MLTASPVVAAVTPEQFAFGLPLQVSGGQAFYELELPLAVYQGCQRDDLGDLRVFNSSGKVVPHALRRPDNKRVRQDVAVSVLPFFPLQAERSGDDLSIHVERTKEGTIVNVRAGQSAVGQDANRGSGYLLDASHLKQRIDWLELLWTDEAEAFLSEVVVETSHDLVSWQPLTTATVGWLRYQDFRLDQNRISLPRPNSRYLRLRGKDGRFAGTLAKVTMLTRESSIVAQPKLKRLTRRATRLSENKYRIDLGGALPVSSVSVKLQDKNSLATVRLSSARNEKDPGVHRWQGLAYNISLDGRTVENPAISVTTRRHRFWDLQVEKSETPLAVVPQLEFMWQPDRLVFLAQGSGPYFVAYGSNTLAPTTFHVDSLLRLSGPDGQKSFKPDVAVPGKPYELGGRENLSDR
ncbi:MAG: hypothetical protein C0623_05235, partial [Desulfuromonas sp.]